MGGVGNLTWICRTFNLSQRVSLKNDTEKGSNKTGPNRTQETLQLISTTRFLITLLHAKCYALIQVSLTRIRLPLPLYSPSFLPIPSHETNSRWKLTLLNHVNLISYIFKPHRHTSTHKVTRAVHQIIKSRVSKQAIEDSRRLTNF